jgi:adenylate cyclase
MFSPGSPYSFFSIVSQYRFRRILTIAIFWTLIDVVVVLLSDYPNVISIHSISIRALLVFIMSLFMGYLFVFTLRGIFKNRPLFIHFLAKIFLLLIAAFLMTFLLQFVDSIWIKGYSGKFSFELFIRETLHIRWLLQRTLYWIVLFVVTQLYIEINDKYSPGVFIDILMGRYIKPKIENRIIMFIDLKDSTPIAEKLGHHQYFLFIREVIFHISMALIEHDGIIYQYVGDEIVVSWRYSRATAKKALLAVIEARKNIQRNSVHFRRWYDLVPEFRVGIHVGEVTVGEIGVIKKDLAMSGDTMNTTARIRSACNELNQKFIVSKDFVDCGDLKDWQTESLGVVELKGKALGLELYSLKI